MKPHLACEADPKYPLRFPLLVSRKLDGIRVVMVEGKALTRSLKPIPNRFIRNWLESYAPDGFDGEVIVGPSNLETTYNTTVSAVMAHGGVPDFTYFVFDLHNKALVYKERLAMAQQLWAAPFVHDNVCMRWLEQTLVFGGGELEALYLRFLDEGYEGAILKDPEGLYKFGRSTPKEQSMIKVKPFADGEARITAVYEALHNTNEAFTNELGRTDRPTHQEGLIGNGMIGGFMVEDLVSGVQFKCAPGTFNHTQRQGLWEQRTTLPGQILKYRSMPYGVKDAPRFPRALGFRSTIDM